MESHFSILRASKFFEHQWEIESRSSRRSWQSDGSQIFLKSLRSSGNSKQLEKFKIKGQSSINMLNKSGPRWLSCGTPDVTINQSNECYLSEPTVGELERTKP